jgi:tetratricopeptide (TPR) repeat protein
VTVTAPVESPESTLERGIALQRAGRLADAEQRYREILELRPDDPAALHYLGLLNYQRGSLDSAEALIERSLKLQPGRADAWNDLGVVMLKAEKPNDAIRFFSRALELDANHLDALNNLAEALGRLLRFDQAAVVLQRLAKLRPWSARVMASLGQATFHSGKVAEAVAAYHEAIRLDPDDCPARIGLGEACESLGKFRQARMQYYSVLRRQPDNSEALAKLLQLRDGTVSASWVDNARGLSRAETLESSARLRLGVSLAHYLDRVGAYDEAFQYLKAAQDERARAAPFDADGYTRAIDTLIRFLDRDFFSSAASSGNRSDQPIFIIGMPRSGTTLTEQILSSHSRVVAGGELPILLDASFRIRSLSGDHRPYPQGLTGLKAADLAALAERYLKELDKLAPGGRRVTDKLPFNFMHVAVIDRLFPRAKIIHCRRDPLDNCLSCYFTSFADEIQFGNDLRTLGRYYADYRRLMAHWHSVLPGRVFDLTYERLIGDTRTTIAELLSHCELEWEDSCLRFYETERQVRTPSRWQVRQPIYDHSIGRWRYYCAHLEPLAQELGVQLAGVELGARLN